VAAGLDMVMLDDLWNTTRDSITPSAAMNQSIRSLAEFSKALADRGLLFGLWFSLTGGGHGQGRDLGDPAMRTFKRGQIETLITQFRMTHQMIDLTEYWQTDTTTAWSHPSDSAYRKAVMAKRMMNELVTAHPQLLPKMTSELDIFPTQGDRNNGLIHVCNNGWNTANGGVTGENLSLRTALTGFGHLPMESAYMNIGRVTGKMEDYYSYLAVRAVKFGQDPGNTTQWPQAGITLLATFNRWRKSPRVRALTEQLFRPVYLGTGWDSTNWNSATGPYVWMYTDVDRTRALVIATGSGGTATGVQANLRWLSDTTTYMISDISLADNGSHSYAYRGTFLGSTLKANRFPIDLRLNPSRGKAFWIERAVGTGLQVQYADEFVTSWTATATATQLTVQVTGQANATATLIVVNPAANRGLVRTVPLNGQGTGTLTVLATALVPPQPVSTTFGDPVLSLANEVTRTVVPATVATTEVSDANASNGGWIRADFTATGQRIEYAVDVPENGLYKVDVRFSENTDRGRSQPYLDGQPLGSELNHYYPGQVYQGVEFRERTLGIRALTAGRHTLAFESTGTQGTSLAVGVDSIVLTPTLARDRAVVELESVWAASSKSCDPVADPAASPARNGTRMDLAATDVGDWMESRVTVPAAGRYRIATMVHRHVARGQFQLRVDGQPLGEVVDLHLPTSEGDYQYTEVDHGTVSFDSRGEKTLRYTVVGRNDDSTSFGLVIDYVALTSIPSMTITAPPTISVGQQVQLQAAGTDLGSYADPRLLLWSVDDADSGAAAFIDDAGRITGREPGTAVVRVRSQVDPAVTTRQNITVQQA
jgi:hypothetical protein